MEKFAIGERGQECLDGSEAGAVFEAVPGEQRLGEGNEYWDLLEGRIGRPRGSSIHRNKSPRQVASGRKIRKTRRGGRPDSRGKLTRLRRPPFRTGRWHGKQRLSVTKQPALNAPAFSAGPRTVRPSRQEGPTVGPACRAGRFRWKSVNAPAFSAGPRTSVLPGRKDLP